MEDGVFVLLALATMLATASDQHPVYTMHTLCSPMKFGVTLIYFSRAPGINALHYVHTYVTNRVENGNTWQ